MNKGDNVKNKNKFLKIIAIFFIVITLSSNVVFGQITNNKNWADNLIESPWVDGAVGYIGDIMNMTVNFGIGFLAQANSTIAVVLIATLQLIFSLAGVSNNIFSIPFPDNVVFNTVDFLDANFINPYARSLMAGLKPVFSNLYSSFVIIAEAMFIIVAMIVGIKLALSTLASQKAKYKQAIVYWITGILLIFALKWIIAGMFKVNEAIAAKAYEIAYSESMEFDIYTRESIPIVGKTISDLLNNFGVEGTTGAGIKVPGYAGLVTKYLLEGRGGNFISSLVAVVVLGQTIAIVVIYIKRVFFCSLLGLMGPIVVAVDTLNKSMGLSSKIFAGWLKQLALAIFTQSFHAIFMVIIIKLMVGVGEETSFEITNYMEAILIIVLTTSLVKMEKIVKQLFGMNDPLMGNLAAGAGQALATIKGVEMAGRAIGDNGKKLKAAQTKKKGLLKEREQFVERQKQSNSGTSTLTTDPATGNPVVAPNTTTNNTQNTNTTQNNTTTRTSSQTQQQAGNGAMSGDDEIKNILKEMCKKLDANNNGGGESSGKTKRTLEDIDADIAKANADIASARLATLLSPSSVAVGTAFGLGLDSVPGGAFVTTGMDWVAETTGRHASLARQKRKNTKVQDVGDT